MTPMAASTHSSDEALHIGFQQPMAAPSWPRVLQRSSAAGHGSNSSPLPVATQLRRPPWQQCRHSITCSNAAPSPAMAAAPRLSCCNAAPSPAWQQRRHIIACCNAAPLPAMAAARRLSCCNAAPPSTWQQCRRSIVLQRSSAACLGSSSSPLLLQLGHRGEIHGEAALWLGWSSTQRSGS